MAAEKPSSGLSLFFRTFLAHPLATAAQLPSSRALGREMVQATLGTRTGPVIEFGAGTGAITDCLLAHGCQETDLILVEQNDEFCVHLRHRYPRAEILQADAITASRALKGTGCIGAISGLPLVQVPAPTRLRFVSRCLDTLLQDGGRFSQFTYGLQSPVVLSERSRIHAVASRRVWLNLWPARVWTYCRSQGA